jgi:hypothetical protein
LALIRTTEFRGLRRSLDFQSKVIGLVARSETCLLCRSVEYIGALLPMWRNWQTRQTQNHYKSLGIK